MSKVDITMAQETVASWLDSKKISETKRTKQQMMIENLVEAVAEGQLVLDDNGNWEQHLLFPIKDEHGTDVHKTIKYKSRITDLDLVAPNKAIKGLTFADELNKAILALTKLPVNCVLSLDRSTDKQVAESIACFFL